MIYFAKDSRTMVETLFRKGGTAQGVYKKKGNGYLLCRGDGTPVVYIAKERTNIAPLCWPVSVSVCNGKVYFMNGLCSKDAQWAGVPEGYMDSHKWAKAMHEQCSKGLDYVGRDNG